MRKIRKISPFAYKKIFTNPESNSGFVRIGVENAYLLYAENNDSKRSDGNIVSWKNIESVLSSL